MLLVGGTVTACFASGAAARVLLYAYPLIAVGIGLWFLATRRSCAYVAFAIGLWLLSPEVRRIIDWKSSYHELSPISLTAPLVALLALPIAFNRRARVRRDVRAAMTVALVGLAFATAVGLVRNGPSTVAASLLSYGGPLSLGMFVLTAPVDDQKLRRTLQTTALWGGIVVGGYGLIQFFFLPAWDLAWLLDSGFSTAGRPAPLEVRVFSTLNSPGPAGQVLAVLLLLLLADTRRYRRALSAGLTIAALGLTLLRSAWAGVALGIALLLVAGRIRLSRVAAILLVLVVAGVAFAGPVLTSVTERFSETTASGSADTSLNSRLTFQTQIAGQTLTNPLGQGLGSTGLATQLAAERPSDPRTANFDSGLFETLTNLGAVFGVALLICVATAVVGVWRRGRRGSMFDAVSAAALASLLLGLLFTNTLRDSFGVFLWCLLGLQGRATPQKALQSPSDEVPDQTTPDDPEDRHAERVKSES